MYKKNICSPPLSSETRLFNVPDGDTSDVIFTFNFDIEKTGVKNNVSFTLDLNSKLNVNEGQCSPPVDPAVYTFDANGSCSFNHQIEEYYVKGNIKIISFNTPVGQFDNNSKNFLFDIATGISSNPPHCIEGLFELVVMPSPDPE